MKTFYLLLFSLIMSQISAQDTTTTTIYFIRHCEKADAFKNPDLSEAGKIRAQKWATHFEKTPIDIFYTSLYKRTQQTCTTVATSQGKEILFYKPETLDLKKIVQENPGKTILFVGHTNTIPKNINAFLGQQAYLDIDDSVYGNLYTIKISGQTVTHEVATP